MALITGPFLRLVFFTLIAAIIIRFVIESGGLPKSAWCLPSPLGAVMGSVNYLSYIYYGYDRFEFTLTVVFAAAVCYNSIRRSRELGEQAEMINRLARELKRFEPECELPWNAVEEDLGRSPIQLLLGFILGVLLTMLMGSMTAFQYSTF